MEIVELKDKGLEIIYNDNFTIVFNKNTKELSIHSGIKVNLEFCKDLEIKVNGDLDITVDGEINLHTTEDLSIDSKTIFLNSDMSKQVRSNQKQINNSMGIENASSS